ncbi:sugar ABC transporter permease [Tuanshanicoccus lijuaniae]|uniref:carbohydrate ABC transporter permease n=1 Tax=Aerococcaceae bacterium zg-1292 TaxID=2774330 RepID=UPI0019371114|nr:sugar ABC transporter permease [Aerococcaceae bacterium zg-1292]MBF6626598.1 sugar ABC transporter permease [Aerococcaceae bacterium zg-BR9]MBF6978963.1 sugar ABC transporter permease [Aerococcaceae bacterium zg-BR22]MBS4455397.1 sugar ABC transporter permease [Aerococcaceae bacterium zg-A91]MBS4457357.1 sugar ABC transporter permease [Aerococcaceae bacterium zg-BR33]
MNSKKSRTRFALLCVLPATILFLIFMIYPTFQVFKMSLYKWGGYSPNKTFVGLNNFRILMEDMKFVKSFQNTILAIVVVTIITLTLAIIFAAILSREKIKGQNFFRIIFYIPNILSIVVIAGIFSAIYNPKQGLLNSILSLFSGGNQPILWLGDKHLVNYAIIGALIWQAIGYYMVMYMASMANIPDSFYEAADLDGAGKFKQFFAVTLPLVWNNIRTTLTFFIISTINLSFLLVQTMTSGGPNGASEVVLSYMYKQAYSNSSYGYAMAIGVVVFTFSFVLSAIVSFVTKRDILEY